MKKIIPFLIVVVIIVGCKNEKKSDAKNMFDISSIKSCDDILNLYDKGIKVYEEAYIKYFDALDKYKKANPNVEFIDNEGKVPEGYKKIMQEVENQVSGFNTVTKDEKIANLYKECSKDEGFSKKTQERIRELQTRLKEKSPEKFHILIDLSVEQHIKESMF